MAVPLKDTESENLLDYLEVCIDFIDQSRKEGGVLGFTCVFICNPSVITAYLMRSENMSLEELCILDLSVYFSVLLFAANALESLKVSCELVFPNDGFLEQGGKLKEVHRAHMLNATFCNLQYVYI
ncbi:unnamed protein product [Vicia faba]|uniref:protein-tyrosine-phosphatase n=1 Tax=Vicia faba TaxID=3906 RepID=A0AAV1A590_VICFA|nr:unnamed protein product [Vicia faba]